MAQFTVTTKISGCKWQSVKLLIFFEICFIIYMLMVHIHHKEQIAF